MVRDGCPTQRALAGSHRRSRRAQGRRQVTQKACAERPTSVVDAAPEVWSAVHANRPSSAPERKSSQRNRKSASQLVSPKLRSPAGYDLSELPEAGKFDADPPFCRSSVTKLTTDFGTNSLPFLPRILPPRTLLHLWGIYIAEDL